MERIDRIYIRNLWRITNLSIYFHAIKKIERNKEATWIGMAPMNTLTPAAYEQKINELTHSLEVAMHEIHQLKATIAMKDEQAARRDTSLSQAHSILCEALECECY